MKGASRNINNEDQDEAVTSASVLERDIQTSTNESLDDAEADATKNSAGGGAGPAADEVEVEGRESDMVDDYENEEVFFDFNVTLPTQFERLPCFPHTLQLVISDLQKVKTYTDLCTKAKALVSKVCKT
jgi:hypothetical protein